MRLRHLVFHQVLANLDRQLGVREIVEVGLGSLETVHVGMAGGLVTMPGVVRPVTPGFGFVGSHIPNVGINEGQGVRHPVHAVLANDPQQTHATAEFHRPGARFAHLLDHLRLIALSDETPTALVTRVRLSDVYQTPGDGVVGLVPGDSGEGVGTATCK